METSIKCWSVKKNAPPREAEPGAPELERHLEDWIEKCIDLVDPSLLVIGRQVENMDLITIDDEGQLVVIELKRDQLPRTVLAQALDYASAVASWTPEKVVAIANGYLATRSGKSLHDAFEKCFGKSLEDTGGINSGQRVMLAGCRTDSALDRTVNWLSERGVPINVVTLSFFALPDGQNVLVRSVLVSEVEAKARNDAQRGRRPPMSDDEVRNVVADLDLEGLLRPFEVLDVLTALTKTAGLDGVDYEVRIPRPDGPPLRRKAFQILIRPSRRRQLRVGLVVNNFTEFLNIGKDELVDALPKLKWDSKVSWRLEADLQNLEECQELCDCLVQLLERSQERESETQCEPA
jgi:hypothetical protein